MIFFTAVWLILASKHARHCCLCLDISVFGSNYFTCCLNHLSFWMSCLLGIVVCCSCSLSMKISKSCKLFVFGHAHIFCNLLSPHFVCFCFGVELLMLFLIFLFEKYLMLDLAMDFIKLNWNLFLIILNYFEKFNLDLMYLHN